MGYDPLDQLRLGPLCVTSGNCGPSARQTPEGACRGADYVPPLWCGHLKSHLYLSGIRHSQWSYPSPGLGAKWRKIIFSPVVTGGA